MRRIRNVKWLIDIRPFTDVPSAAIWAKTNAEQAIRLVNSEDETVQLAVLRYLTVVTEKHWQLDDKALVEQVVKTAVPAAIKTTHPLIRQILWRCGLK